MKTTRFDDVDHNLGYAYHGCSYVIQDAEHVFHIRIYDDEPGKATVIRPTQIPEKNSLGKLVEFLQSELGVSRVSFYKGDQGRYADIDLVSLAFRPA
ncbi:hypothetical protein NUH87_06265 [Pseudomonas batumici]|uniref:hypothetical protein n=1 Tax=Pseudomonas batumici TaxID=226910 RepID=UPI0030D2B65B